MDIITSKDNARISAARKLLQKKYRDKESLYLIEGFHLLEEALKANVQLTEIFVSADKVENTLLANLQLTVVSDEVLKSLSDEKTPQGVVAVVKKAETMRPKKGKFLVLENVQDPGNVGTMIRTADAAGYDAVICLGNTGDIYSPKVLRSAQGSHFHLPVLKSDTFPETDNLLVTTLSADSRDYHDLSRLTDFALVMGNEAQGVSAAALAAATQKVHIPMSGRAESLNVAVAAGILMFGI